MGGSLFPEWVPTLNPVDCRSIGAAYLSQLPVGLPGQSRTTDKWLENLEYLGLLAICLPNARFIHCQRDRHDQVFSCWAMLFSENQEYAYTPHELGRYVRAYEELMEHWHAVLPPGRMLEVSYEALVADPEAGAKRILAHCDLDWDPQVLRYWESKRPVRSASLTQVREPIYDRSIGRWKPFEPYLGYLFDAVEG